MRKFKLFLFISSLITLGTSYAQDSTQTELNQKILAAVSGNTKMIVTGSGWFGFSAKLNSTSPTDVKTNFDSYGFAPLFLWKLSDKMFFESEIEIVNGEFELEYAKLSYNLNKYMTIGAGRMLSPFGAYGERWEPVFIEKFPNTPLLPDGTYLPAETHLNWGALMGIDLRGALPLGSAKMNYVIFVSNGPTLDGGHDPATAGMIDYENLYDNNNNKEIGGRLGLLPFSSSSLEIGFSGRYGKAGNQGDSIYNNIGVTAYAIDLSYNKSINPIKSSINIRGQYNAMMVDKANYYLTDSTMYTFDNNLSNYFIQFSIRPNMLHNKFLKKTELMFRYNSLTAPKDAVWGAKDKNGNGGSVERIDIGLAYWLNWKSGIRMAYEDTSLPDGTKIDEFLASIVYGF
jgi:hypothetical protein